MSYLKPYSCRGHDLFFKEVHKHVFPKSDPQCPFSHAMFAVGTTHSRYNQPFGKSYVPQVSKGFSVRVLKGPTFPSFPYVAPSKFDQNNRIPSTAEPRQSQKWFSSRSNSTSPNDLSKLSRPHDSSHPNVSTNQAAAYNPSAHSTTPRYTIYQSSKDTYVYDPSLSSKTDLSSTSEDDDASTATYTPSSVFSPAMSTDSITTIRGAATPDVSSTDLRSTTPAPSSSSSTAYIPSLMQARSADRNMFRDQTLHEGPTTVVHPLHASHAVPRPLTSTGSSDVSRSTTPTRLSALTSGSVQRAIYDSYSANSSSGSSHPPTRVHTPSSDSEHTELDRLARANAQYNAASSAASSAFYSARDSMNLSNATDRDNGVRIFPELPLRRSPPQHNHSRSPVLPAGNHGQEKSPPHRLGTDSSVRISENSVPQNSSYHHASPSSEATLTNEREPLVPRMFDLTDGQRLSQPSSRSQPEEPSTSQIPQVRNEGPASSRYVPASRTMFPNKQPETRVASPQPAVTVVDDRVKTTLTDPQRERRTSISSTHASLSSILPLNTQGRGHLPPDAAVVVDDDPAQPLSHTHYHNNDSEHSHRTGYLSTAAPSTVRRSGIQSPTHIGPEPNFQAPQSTQPVIPEPQDYLVPPTLSSRTSDKISATKARQLKEAPLDPQSAISPEEIQRHPSPFRLATQLHERTSQNVALSYPNIPFVQGITDIHQNRRDSIISSSHPPPILTTSPNNIPAVKSSAHAPHAAHQNHRVAPKSANPYHDIRHSLNAPQHDTGYNLRETRARVNSMSSGHNLPDLAEHSAAVLPAVYPSVATNMPTSQIQTAPTQMAFTRTRSNSSRRLSDYLPNQPAFAVPTVYSDPGPGNEYQRSSFTELSHRVGGNAPQSRSVSSIGNFTQGLQVVSTASGTRTSSSVAESSATRSRTPHSDVRPPLPEPQRSNSDGDQNMVNGLIYPRGHPVFVTSDGYASASTEPQPQRRNSDGAQANTSDRRSLALFRTVRWDENLICPSPIFPHQRRKGWFNRRGDQLWTNNGAYKPACTGQEYPPDLDDYPEHGDGWMNEECIRIDMGHRLIPKPPLKSALKQPRA